MRPARVIGAGIAGLTTAWHLADGGFTVTVFDAAAGPGGLIQTRQSAYGPIETAANAFVWSDTVAGWFSRLDLEPVFARSESKRRYIYRDGRPRRWPLSIGESAILAGRFGIAAASRRVGARERETVAEWGDRVLGPAARQWLLEPAMQGIYASEASALSARAIFSGRRRGARLLAAPSGGMGEFVSRLCERLVDRGVQLSFGARVETIEPQIPTAICTGAHAASLLLAEHVPDLSARIRAVPVAPLATVTMFFAPHPRDLRGFGVLFPEPTGIHALGVLFNTDIFERRGHFRSETWIVGDRRAGITTWTDVALQKALTADREHLTGRRDEPLAVHITRWSAAVPVYNEAILDVKAGLALLPPWLALAGNYVGRIGVAALLDQGAEAAQRLNA
jgi:oxygen-dependent protoporphyrinogen oxidase